ncbi:MAG: Gfo/Idh/MocA family oxidoreductase [Chloroflexi bacterium]|nr:Gfo/Idh/MocA family oxidoreductase [Chloroflexota bacterium]
MQKLGVGVLGAGNVSTEHIRSYMRNPQAEVVALYSRTRETAEQRAALTGLSCPIYTDLEKFLQDERIQAVSICTTNDVHAQHTIAAAQAGKHVLIEKPVALNLADLHAMDAAVRKAGVRSMVSFVLRRNPQVRMMRRQLDEGAIGDVFMAEVDYWHSTHRAVPGQWMSQKARAGSVFLMGGCHAVDAARFLVGQEAVEVSAYSTKGKGRAYYDYDPTVIALVRFASGAIGKISATMECEMPYAFNIILMGDKGTLWDDRIWSHMLAGQTDWARVPTVRPSSGDVAHHPFQAQIDDFVAAILSGTPLQPDLPDAVRTHEVVLAIDRSVAAGGKAVSLPLQA